MSHEKPASWHAGALGGALLILLNKLINLGLNAKRLVLKFRGPLPALPATALPNPQEQHQRLQSNRVHGRSLPQVVRNDFKHEHWHCRVPLPPRTDSARRTAPRRVELAPCSARTRPADCQSAPPDRCIRPPHRTRQFQESLRVHEALVVRVNILGRQSEPPPVANPRRQLNQFLLCTVAVDYISEHNLRSGTNPRLAMVRRTLRSVSNARAHLQLQPKTAPRCFQDVW